MFLAWLKISLYVLRFNLGQGIINVCLYIRMFAPNQQQNLYLSYDVNKYIVKQWVKEFEGGNATLIV